jgi:hypothetical protein
MTGARPVFPPSVPVLKPIIHSASRSRVIPRSEQVRFCRRPALDCLTATVWHNSIDRDTEVGSLLVIARKTQVIVFPVNRPTDRSWHEL